jgi:hypothetical protein
MGQGAGGHGSHPGETGMEGESAGSAAALQAGSAEVLIHSKEAGRPVDSLG